jgi:hypothetical protein
MATPVRIAKRVSNRLTNKTMVTHLLSVFFSTSSIYTGFSVMLVGEKLDLAWHEPGMYGIHQPQVFRPFAPHSPRHSPKSSNVFHQQPSPS